MDAKEVSYSQRAPFLSSISGKKIKNLSCTIFNALGFFLGHSGSYDVNSIPGVNFSPSLQETFDGIDQDLVPNPAKKKNLICT